MLTEDEIIALRHRASSRRRDITKPWSDTLVFAREVEARVRADCAREQAIEALRPHAAQPAIGELLRALATPPAGA